MPQMDTSRRPQNPPAVPHDGHDRARTEDAAHREERLSTGVLSRPGGPAAPGHPGRGPHHQADGSCWELQSPYRAGHRTQPRLYLPLAEKTRFARPDQRRLRRYLPNLQGGGKGEDRRATQEGRLAIVGLSQDRDPSEVRPQVGLAGGSETEGRADPQCALGARPDDQAADRRGHRDALEGHAEEPAQQRSGGQLPGPFDAPRPGRGHAAGKRGPRQGKGPLNQHLRFAGLAEPRPAEGHG